MSPSVQNVLGYPPSFFLDDFSRFLDILSDDDRAVIDRGFLGEPLPERSDFHFRHANGSIVDRRDAGAAIDGGLQGVGRDVTELRQLQDDLAALALRDPLTGLANRRLLKELLDADLARTQRSGVPLGGRVPRPRRLQAGQRLARSRSRRHRAVRDGAAVAGDRARRRHRRSRRWRRVRDRVRAERPKLRQPHPTPRRSARPQPIRVRIGISVCCPASIGVADSGTAGYDAAALMAAADAAMYRAKRSRHRAARRRLLVPASVGHRPVRR